MRTISGSSADQHPKNALLDPILEVLSGARLRANPAFSWPGFFTTEDTEGTEFVEFKRLSYLGPGPWCLHSVPSSLQGHLTQAVLLSVFLCVLCGSLMR